MAAKSEPSRGRLSDRFVLAVMDADRAEKLYRDIRGARTVKRFDSPTRNRVFTRTTRVVRHKSLDLDCHSERSEESRLPKYMRPFSSFRVTGEKLFRYLVNVEKLGRPRVI
jgi:catechol 2,3-dioxygenase-like lactoylglutathione lyase family enzyme